jgi:CheY-like chemotaxis protein
MLSLFKQKIMFVALFSVLLLASLVAIISVNIALLDAKYDKQLTQLKTTTTSLFKKSESKQIKNIPLFKDSNAASVIESFISSDKMTIYIAHLNNHIEAINSLNNAKRLLSDELSADRSATHLAAVVIQEKLESLRAYALSQPAELVSYQDRYLKEAIFLLENISTSELNKEQRQAVLSRSYQKLVSQAVEMTDLMTKSLSDEQSQLKNIMYSFIALSLFFLTWLLRTISTLTQKANRIQTQVLFVRDYLRDNNGRGHNSSNDTTPLESLYNEAKISVGVLAKKNAKISKLYQNTQKANGIAGLLGYEIQALTSIVAGGLSLNSEKEDLTSTFNTEINEALASLENLSDNFTNLFSNNIQKINLDEEFDLQASINKILVLTNSKARSLNKEFDFIIDNSTPLFAAGEAYRFYWCVYNILVRCIENVEGRHCLVHISAKEGSSIENKKLIVKLISSNGSEKSAEKLINSKLIAQRNETLDINSILYSNIINTFFDGNVTFRRSEQNDTHISISLTIIPKSYTAKAETVKSKILLFAQDNLQSSIVTNKLKNMGAAVARCDSQDKLLKILSGKQPFDSVVFIENLSSKNEIQLLKAASKKVNVVLLSKLTVKNTAVEDIVSSTVRLPMFRNEMLQALSKEAPIKEAETELRILIVDDDPSQQFILSHFLKRVGITPSVANNCEDALASIKENDFDLIFMDCIMPGTDGFETTKLIRSHEDKLQHLGELDKPLTIIGNTSLTSADEIDKCISSGMDAILNKPYKNDKIIELLNRYKV